MARSPAGARLRSGAARAAGALFVIGVLAPLVGLVVLQAQALTPPALPVDVGAKPTTAPPAAKELIGKAADALSAAVGPGGSGFRFQVVARSTLNAKQGGPLIDIPHPTERDKTLGVTDEYYLGASLAEGLVVPAGFWLQMREGPLTPDASPDFAAAVPTLAALVRDGERWRNDGTGWYQADVLPGIGLDPATLEVLPRLLREATDIVATEEDVLDGRPVANVRASGDVADAPGLMAVDAAPFTEFAGPLTFSIDASGRLAQLRAVMRNTTVRDFDLLVETTVTFLYDTQPMELPDPVPLAAPADDSATED